MSTEAPEKVDATPAAKEGGHALKARLSEKRVRTRAVHQNPVNQIHHDEATLGERVADKFASGIGSWPFLIIQTVVVIFWVAANLIGFIYKWDQYPFILLNLMFSVQAAYAGPIILLAGNRQSQKDRLTLEHASMEADKADQQNVQILKEIAANSEVTLQILRHTQALGEQRGEILKEIQKQMQFHNEQVAKIVKESAKD